MINVVYDNVIFSIQRSGGISVYWKELIERIQKDDSINLKILEYQGSENNIFRSKLSFKNNQLDIQNTFLNINISRYINPKIQDQENTIFHSSYYRTVKATNIKNIVTVHDFTYEKKNNSTIGKIHIYQKKKALENADGIICISENTKKDMLELYPNLYKKKIKVIYNGYNKNDYIYNPEIITEDQVLFVGARKGYKNFDKAVIAVSETSNISLAIVGPPIETDEEILLKKMLANRYQSFVHVSNEELNLLYNQSICLLYLSEYEGFGIPILEAMSAGCPVVALRKSSIPEVAGDAGILFSDFDKNNIKNAIHVLKTNAELRVEQIELGLKNVKKYSWDKCYNEVLEFYHEVL